MIHNKHSKYFVKQMRFFIVEGKNMLIVLLRKLPCAGNIGNRVESITCVHVQNIICAKCITIT